MRQSRFPEEQMVEILREADRGSVAEAARKHKVSEQTIYIWRKKFGVLDANDVKRVRELESGNARLKRMLAEREMAPSLQRRATAFESAVHDARRISPTACNIHQPRGRSKITLGTKNARPVTWIAAHIRTCLISRRKVLGQKLNRLMRGCLSASGRAKSDAHRMHERFDHQVAAIALDGVVLAYGPAWPSAAAIE
jgi:putative transposase